MHFSISCGLSFMCVAVLLFLPAQGKLECPTTSPSVIAGGSKLNIHVDCCTSVSRAQIKERVIACCEQKVTFSDCKIHAYIFKGESDKLYCVDPNASWLPDRLQKLKTNGKKCEVWR